MAPYRYDLVVFGATGFTGKRVVEHLLKWQDEPGQKKFTFAVAGRSEKRLNGLMTELECEDRGVGVIVSDVSDSESIKKMCETGKVLLNCVGPYRFYGEEVVKQCVNSSCHYLDICGEPQFIESMQVKYGEAAEQKHVLVISACGFDSIPCDLGVSYVQRHFPGEVTGIESILELHTGPLGGGGHFATFQSAIYGFAHAHELPAIRKAIFTEKLPRPAKPLRSRGNLFWSDEVDGYCAPFPGADRSVVRRTQYHRYTRQQQRPTDFIAYAKIGTSKLAIFMLMIFGGLFSVLSKFGFGRWLLESYPGFFTRGLFTHEGPSEEQMATTSFSMLFLAKGHADKQPDIHQQPSGAPTYARYLVKGPEPGYVATPICLISAAITLLTEGGDGEKLGGKGGVMSPGAAFSTSDTIFKLLNSHGVTFEKIN